MKENIFCIEIYLTMYLYFNQFLELCLSSNVYKWAMGNWAMVFCCAYAIKFVFAFVHVNTWVCVCVCLEVFNESRHNISQDNQQVICEFNL